MARKYSMGYFADGNGAMEGVEYSADFARLQETVEEQSGSLAVLQETVEEQTSLFSEYLDGLCERFDSDEEILSEKLDENLLVMKAVSKQLDTLIELAGEILEETVRRQSNNH